MAGLGNSQDKILEGMLTQAPLILLLKIVGRTDKRSVGFFLLNRSPY